MIPSQREYEQREAMEFLRQRTDCEKSPLAHRKESAAEFAALMAKEPHLVAERILWLVQGCYGFGSCQASRKVAVNTRMNREAWFVQTIGAVEWQCPAEMTRKAWHALTKTQQTILNNMVMHNVSAYMKDLEAEAA